MAEFKKEIKQRKLQWDTGKVDEAKTIELPADTTFTVDLKHLMKKHMAEGKSKEEQLKIAYDALAKAEMSGDIRKQELALAAIDLINGMNEEAMSDKDKHEPMFVMNEGDFE